MNKIRVLIADDHAIVRDGTRRVLESEKDIEVVGEASNGEETVSQATRLQPDVAIIDIAMPKANDIEAKCSWFRTGRCHPLGAQW